PACRQRAHAALFAHRQRFSMTGFGTWHCDRMIPLTVNDGPVQVLASNDEPIRWVKAFGVPAKGRAVITYWSQEGKTEQRMRLSTECERIIFVDAERNMVVADVPAAKRNRKGRLVLHGKPLDQPRDREVLAT